jgi:hypothetical protein
VSLPPQLTNLALLSQLVDYCMNETVKPAPHSYPKLELTTAGVLVCATVIVKSVTACPAMRSVFTALIPYVGYKLLIASNPFQSLVPSHKVFALTTPMLDRYDFEVANEAIC